MNAKKIGVIVSVLSVALGSGLIASAKTIPGRPGQLPVEATIDATGDGSCHARYDETVNGNTFISDAFSDDTRIKVRMNKNNVNAWCKFTDTSLVYETNAEVGDVHDCTLFTEMGTYILGTGKVTAAANNDPKESDQLSNEESGGNVTIHCKFDVDDFEPAPE